MAVDQILVAVQLGSVVAADRTVEIGSRSVVERADRKIQHPVSGLAGRVGQDLPVGLRRTDFGPVRQNECVAVQIAQVDGHHIGRHQHAEQQHESRLLDLFRRERPDYAGRPTTRTATNGTHRPASSRRARNASPKPPPAEADLRPDRKTTSARRRTRGTATRFLRPSAPPIEVLSSTAAGRVRRTRAAATPTAIRNGTLHSAITKIIDTVRNLLYIGEMVEKQLGESHKITSPGQQHREQSHDEHPPFRTPAQHEHAEHGPATTPRPPGKRGRWSSAGAPSTRGTCETSAR